MSRVMVSLVAAIIALTVLVAAGPTIAAVLRDVVPVIIVLAIAVAGLRLLWYFTRGY